MTRQFWNKKRGKNVHIFGEIAHCEVVLPCMKTSKTLRFFLRPGPGSADMSMTVCNKYTAANMNPTKAVKISGSTTNGQQLE